MEKHQGYIVERIIGKHRQELCYEGMLTICDLPACIRPPLSLCQVETIQIKTMGALGCDKERLELTLLCLVMDQHGRRAEGLARLQVDVCRCFCRGHVRRGARIRVNQARFLGENSLWITASVCVYTVISCSEMETKPKRRLCRYPDIPLYPQDSCRKGKGRNAVFFKGG